MRTVTPSQPRHRGSGVTRCRRRASTRLWTTDAAGTEECVNDWARRSHVVVSAITGLQPSPHNFSELSITKSGLEVGFRVFQVAPGTCGTVSMNIPYVQLKPYLNEEGMRLVGVSRQP